MKKWFINALVLWLALGMAPAPAQAQDGLDALGVWQAFEQDSPYRRMAYQDYFYDARRGIVLVVLYDHATQGQLLCQFEQRDGRWQNTVRVPFYGPAGEVGTLYIMNSEDEGVPELVHNAFDTKGKGYFESFWFMYRGGAYFLRDALLTVPQAGTPLTERGVMLKRVPQGITSQVFTYERDSVSGRQWQDDPQLVAKADIPLTDGIGAFPRAQFLPLLADQGLLFAPPRDMPQQAAGYVLSSPWRGWQVTGWAQPGQGDTAFTIVKQAESNVLLCLKQAGSGWALDWVNDQALPQGDITMSLMDASGSEMLVPLRDARGVERTHYGRALDIGGDDGNGEYAVRHSVWEMDEAGRYLLTFYAHEGQSGMMTFSDGVLTYLERPEGTVVQEDTTQRDLRWFSMDYLPDPYQPGGSRAIAVVNNPTAKDRLNLRKLPAATADMIGRYYNGTPVSILDDPGGDWVKVWIGWDRQGYMMRKYLAFGADAAQVVSAMPTYTMNRPWKLYYEPFLQSHVKHSYQGGETIEVMGLMAGWWHVRLADDHETIGFVPEVERL